MAPNLRPGSGYPGTCFLLTVAKMLRMQFSTKYFCSSGGAIWCAKHSVDTGGASPRAEVFHLVGRAAARPCGCAVAAIGDTAMKTKSHGTVFAYPVAPLMWKNGTRHVLMARFDYGAPDRDVKAR